MHPSAPPPQNVLRHSWRCRRRKVQQMTWLAVTLGLAGLIVAVIALVLARVANRAAHESHENVTAAVQAAFSAAADAQKSHQELVARTREALRHEADEHAAPFPGSQEPHHVKPFTWALKLSTDDQGLVTSVRVINEGAALAHDVTFILNSDEHAERSLHFGKIRPERQVDLRAEQTVTIHRRRVAGANPELDSPELGMATDIPRTFGPVDTKLRLSVIAVTDEGTPEACVIEQILRTTEKGSQLVDA